MARNVALTSPELALLNADTHDVPYYLAFVPDVEVAHATITGTILVYPFVQFATTSESAHWADGSVHEGMTAKITDSTGAILRGYYRVRLVPIAGTFYIDEVSNADPGMIAQQSRTAGIAVGDKISILARFDPFAVKPLTRNDTDFQDYNIAVGTHNEIPDPIVNVYFQGSNDWTHYFCNVANGATKAITVQAVVTQWAPDDGTLSYTWTVPAAATSVSGDTTANLSLTLPVGAYWLYCLVESDAGGSIEIKRFVRIFSPADPPVAINVTSDNRGRDSRKLTIRAVNGRIGVVPDGAMCFVFTDGTWGGSDVASASHLFTGYLYRQPYMHRPGHYESTADLLGTCAVLDLLAGNPASWTYTGNTDTWSELPANCSNIQFIIWWVLRWRTKNILECHNFTPFSVNPTLGRRKNNSVSAGTVYSQLKSLGDQYDLNIGSRSNGEIVCALNPSLCNDDRRADTPTRLTLTNSIYSDIQVEWRRRIEEGSLNQSGVASTLEYDYQLASGAPGVKTPGMGGKNGSKSNKLWDGPAHANQTTGDWFAYDNNPYPRITVTIPKHWDVGEPVDMEYITVQVPAEKSPTGLAISLNCCLISVSKTWLVGRQAAMQWTLEAVTDGIDGESKRLETSTDYSGPYSSETPALPESPGWGDEDTNRPLSVPALIVAADDGFVTRGEQSGWTDVSPNAEQRIALGSCIKLIHDPFNFKRYILYAANGAAVCDDITIPSAWRLVNLSTSATAGIGTETFADLTVPADGSTVSSPTTDTGKTYRITLSGTWQVGTDTGSPLFGDAFYRQSAAGGAYDNTDVECNVNGSPFAPTPAFSSSHTYSINVTGDGSAIAFNCNDGTTVDNSGSISVSIVGPASIDTGGTDTVFIADISGSINSQGRFYWLGKQTISGDDKVFLYRTATYWQNVRSVQIGDYDSTLNYSIQTSSYNANVLYITAGAKTYVSTDGGQSVSDAGDTLTTTGGALSVPYNGVASGDNTANAGSPPDYMCVLGQSGGNTEFRAIDGSTTHVFTSNKNIPAFGLNGSTIGGLSINAIETGGTLRTSDDGGLTWSTAAGTLPAGGTVHGINGLPNRPGAALAFGDQTLAGSDDRGATWDDFYSGNYDTFASGAYGGGGTNIVWAQARLDRYYSDEVTTG